MLDLPPSKSDVKEARKKAKLKQEDAAKLIYVNPKTWSKYETGFRQLPLSVYELFLFKTGQMPIDVYKKLLELAKQKGN